jgi:enamine deaminase RidA (YjgF/YER057c/UK114 family)
MWFFRIVLMISIAPFIKNHQRIEATKIPIYIGGFFPLSPNKASVPGHALLAAARLALQHVNNSDILGNHELKMIVKDSKVR